MFDFLSNLYNKAKGAVSDLFSSNLSYPAPPPPSPITTTNPIPTGGNLGAPLSPAGSATSTRPSTSAPVYKPPTPSPVTQLTASGGRVPQVIPTTQPKMRQAVTSTSGGVPSPFMSTNGGTPPTTSSPAGSSFREVVTSSNDAPPPRAAQGAQGTGGFMGSTGGSTLTASQGATGAQGVGGRFYQGAGPLGVYNATQVGSVAEDEAKKRQGEQYSLPPSTPANRYVSPKPEALLGVPAIPSTIDVNTLQQYIKDTSAYLSSPGAKSDADLTNIRTNLQQFLDAGVLNTLQKNGITPEKVLVEDSPELQDFLNGKTRQETFDYQQFADNFRTQNGMSDWLKLKETGKAALTEATKFYNDLIKEVRANPDLPKTLAERRVKLFMDDRDDLIQKARADIEMAQNAIDDINTSLHSQLGIVQAQRNEDDKEKDRELDIFKTLLTNGVEFTPQEKKSWATKLGLSVGALDSIAAKPNLKYETSNGVIYQFDGAGKLLNTFGTPTKVASNKGINYDNPIHQKFLMVAPKAPGANAIATSNFLGLEGNPVAQEKFIEKLAMDGMGATQKTAFVSAGKLANDTQNAIAALDSYKGRSGVYKNLQNKSLPFAGIDQDQEYNELQSRIEAFQGQRINDIYGAALTGGELARANRYFINFATDSVGTIRTKLQNLNTLAQSDKSFYLQTAMGNLDAGIAPTDTPVAPTDQTDDDAALLEEVGSSGGSEAEGFWSDLWKAITTGT